MNDQPTGAPVPPASPPKPKTPSVQGPQRPPYAPPLLWRAGSVFTVAATGFVCRAFLQAFNKLEVEGLDQFLQLLDKRKDVEGRERGLITVSNHLSIVDDPLLFAAVPYSYHLDPNNSRWSLGSHDLMFKNRFASLFFTLGQCLPTHRIQHSSYGGLWQPTMTQAIRLLSAQPFATAHSTPPPTPSSTFLSSILNRPTPPSPPDLITLPDPFTDPSAPVLHPTYTTTGADDFPAPSYHPIRRHAWIHIFPEGRIHQHPTQTMRYFRWGVARLILESEPCPDVVPVWIEGMQGVMPEDREWLRPIPRAGAEVRVVFGDVVGEERWSDVRGRWRGLVEESERRRREEKSRQHRGNGEEGADVEWRELGIVEDEWLRSGKEAEALRMEVAERVREELVMMRRARGWPEEDARARLAGTWKGGRNGLVDVVGDKEGEL